MPYKKIKPTTPTKSESIDRFVSAVRIHDKWKSYRDTLHKLYAIDKEKGKEDYELVIGKYQIQIKTAQRKFSLKPIETIIKLGAAVTGMELLRLLAAGYELMEGNDYCAKALKSK